MIKILKPGISLEDRYFAKCRSCYCEFEFARADGEVIRDSRDGDYIKVACPTCGAAVTNTLQHR